jgi:hypothetical protein
MSKTTWLFLLAVPMAALAQPPGPAPITGRPVVELKGTVSKVSAGPGQGMPYIEVRSGSETVQVTLGSMRYLMQNEFNPKAGDAVVAKGYKMEEGVVAIEVSLAGGKPLVFRDSQGRPMWMQGGYGRQARWGQDKAKR